MNLDPPRRSDPRVDPKTVPPKDAFAAAQRALEAEQLDTDLERLRAVDARYERVLGELGSRVAVLETKREQDIARLAALEGQASDWEHQKSLVLNDLVSFSNKLDAQKKTLGEQTLTLEYIKKALTLRQAVVMGIGLVGTALGQILLKLFHHP